MEQRCLCPGLADLPPPFESDANGSRTRPELAGRQDAAAAGPLDHPADVRDPGQRRLDRRLEQLDCLGRQRLPVGDLGGLRRRLEGTGEGRSVLGLGGCRQTLDDCRQLERHQRVRVHDAFTTAV